MAEPGNHASVLLSSQKLITRASIFVLSSAGIGSSTPALLRALARALTAVRNNPAPILSSPSAIASSTASNARVSAETILGSARPASCRARTLCDESIDIAACGVSLAALSLGSFASQTSSIPSGFEPPTSNSSTRHLTSPTLIASTARVNRPTFRPNVSIQVATPRIALARSSADMSSAAVRATASTNAASDALIVTVFWGPLACIDVPPPASLPSSLPSPGFESPTSQSSRDFAINPSASRISRRSFAEEKSAMAACFPCISGAISPRRASSADARGLSLVPGLPRATFMTMSAYMHLVASLGPIVDASRATARRRRSTEGCRERALIPALTPRAGALNGWTAFRRNAPSRLSSRPPFPG
mmetsp:Transcript_328/g.1265  ORF Transcript_328/g.1265 Transcript_328/m.1265 type:complete len:362 (+) Transcript_328:554-1639(+)